VSFLRIKVFFKEIFGKTEDEYFDKQEKRDPNDPTLPPRFNFATGRYEFSKATASTRFRARIKHGFKSKIK